MITFYIDKSQKTHHFIQLLLELKDDIYIHCNDEAHAQKINNLLWESNHFIPNQIGKPKYDAITAIGYGKPLARTHIINVSDQILDMPHIEWVTQNLEEARSRYKHYKKQHQLSSKTLD